MIITITGTPGTGKTFLAKKMAKNLGCKYVNLNDYIKKHKLYSSYDKKNKTFDVDIKAILGKLNADLKLNQYSSKDVAQKKSLNALKNSSLKDLLSLRMKLKNSIIIDSHLSHYIDSDVCIVAMCDIKKLNYRLKKRKYSKNKIRDNIESEIFQVCLEESKALNRHILTIET